MTRLFGSKENKKLRTEIIQIEVNVKQRVGYLERYREMANFKIMSFQKQLEDCVPVSKLNDLNQKYDELVQNYRQLLDKQDAYEMKADNLAIFEVFQYCSMVRLVFDNE